MNKLNTPKELNLSSFLLNSHSFLLVVESHNTVLSLIFLEYIDL